MRTPFKRPLPTIAATVLTLAALPAALAAADRVSGPVSVDVISVHDGDTFTVMAHAWPDHFIRTAVRVLGVDTPEKRGRCAREKELADAAHRLTEAFLRDGQPITIRNIQPDKYGGRVDADVFDHAQRSLAQALIDARLAHAYDGGRKSDWCS